MRDVVGIWLGALDGTTWWEQDSDEPVLAASLMKVPVAMAALALDLDRSVVVHPDFDSVVTGERFELDEEGDQDPDTWAEVGGEQTLRELRRRSIVFSGNLATNLVMEQTGVSAVTAVMPAGAPDDRRPAGHRRRHRQRRVGPRLGAAPRPGPGRGRGGDARPDLPVRHPGRAATGHADRQQDRLDRRPHPRHGDRAPRRWDAVRAGRADPVGRRTDRGGQRPHRRGRPRGVGRRP